MFPRIHGIWERRKRSVYNSLGDIAETKVFLITASIIRGTGAQREVGRVSTQTVSWLNNLTCSSCPYETECNGLD